MATVVNFQFIMKNSAGIYGSENHSNAIFVELLLHITSKRPPPPPSTSYTDA